MAILIPLVKRKKDYSNVDILRICFLPDTQVSDFEYFALFFYYVTLVPIYAIYVLISGCSKFEKIERKTLKKNLI